LPGTLTKNARKKPAAKTLLYTSWYEGKNYCSLALAVMCEFPSCHVDAARGGDTRDVAVSLRITLHGVKCRKGFADDAQNFPHFPGCGSASPFHLLKSCRDGCVYSGLFRCILERQGVKPKLLIGLTSSSSIETLQGCAKQAEGIIISTSFAPVTREAKMAAEQVAKFGGSADLHSAAAYEIMFILWTRFKNP
jgi:hypothetical protein